MILHFHSDPINISFDVSPLRSLSFALPGPYFPDLARGPAGRRDRDARLSGEL